MTISFRPATRENVALLLGLAGASGSGKSFSAMRLAKGIAGDKPFAVVDTENGRAKHYADLFKFDHGALAPPFSPEHYLEAILAAESAGYSVIVVDSFSHVHAGEGGLLDMHEAELHRMAGDDWRKRETSKMAAWVRPKNSNKRLVSRMLQLRAHVILTFRAEQKVDVVRGEDGKMQVVPKRILSGFSDWIPVCEKNILYELTASLLLTPDAPGVPHPIKLQDTHRPFFPPGEPISEAAGAALAAWARGGVSAPDRARRRGGSLRARATRQAMVTEIRALADSAAGPRASASRRGKSSVAGSRSTRWIWASCSGCASTCSMRRPGRWRARRMT